MKLTIVKEDGVVGVDGLFLPVDLSSLPDNLHAVQWDGTTGHVEIKNESNIPLTGISEYQSIIDAWQVANDDRIARQDPYYGMTEVEKAAAMLQKSKDDIAAQRYTMETSGVQYNGFTISTDRESVQILDSTMEKIRRGVVPSVNWKCPEGYLELNTTNIDSIELVVLTHVQNAFAWEKSQLESL